ncbi:MAG: phage portal protein [Bacteroidales bacterium]|nr:phage portal protein [Bacteroidales bacterium]
MLGKGRNIITTTYREVTMDNVIKIIQQAMPFFRQNAADCDFLMNYDAGEQPLVRENEKKVMPWIDCQAVDNVAHEISDFWVGYMFGNPITLVQRGDSEKSDEKAQGIRNLNNYYALTGSARDQQKIANYIVKCGHCYTLCEINKEWEKGESYFTRDVLDPRCAFVVRSSAYSDRRVILGVSLAIDTEDNYTIYACSKDAVYFIYAQKVPTNQRVSTEKYDEWKNGFNWVHLSHSGEKNPMGKVTITEWYWNPERTGAFENQISALDNINLLVSDISNGFEQNIQAIWWSNNVDFQTKIVKDEETGEEYEVVVKPKNGEWVETHSSKDGGNPSIQPLTIDYHLEDMQKAYTDQRDLALQRAHVPNRNETSGGSSGVAMDSASGWADAEAIATSRDEVVKGCLKDEIKVVLAVLRESTDIDVENPVLSLYSSDVEVAIRRPKNSDLATRTNAIVTLLSHGFELEDAVATIPLFADATQVVSRSGEGVKKYQNATVFGSDTEESRTMQDMSDNASNSPYLNG